MQKFDTTAPITARIDIPAGRIQVIAADRKDATVEVRPANAGKGRDVKAAEETVVEFADGVLRVESPERKQYFGPTGSVEVTVQLPAGSHLEVKAASAELRVVGRLGEVAYDGAHGDIKIDEAAGARLVTQAGDVILGRLTGAGEVSVAKGDITVTEAVRGALVLTTQAGDITVGAARGTNAALDAGTSYGRIDNSLQNASGTPELTVRATTSYGNITARSL